MENTMRLDKGLAAARSATVNSLKQLGQLASNTAKQAVETGRAAGDKLQHAGREVVKDTFEAGARAARTSSKVLEPALKVAVKATQPPVGLVEPALKAGEAIVRDVRNAHNLRDNVARLGEGDTYKEELGAELGVVGGKGSLKGTLEVARTQTKYETDASGATKLDAKGQPVVKEPSAYTVSASGDVALAVSPKTTAPGAQFDVEFGGGGQVKQEYNFATAEEAARGSSILRRQAASEAFRLGAESAKAPLGLAGTLVPTPESPVRPSEEELKFLESHRTKTTVELRVGAKAFAEAKLGLSDKDQLAGLEAAAQGEKSVAVEFEKGKAPTLVFKDQVTLEASQSVGYTRTDGNQETPTGAGTGTGTGVRGKVALSSETRLPLPEGTDLAALTRDPASALRTYAGKAYENAETKLTAVTEGQAQVAGKGFATEGKVELVGKPSEVLRPEVLGNLRRGDVVGALETAGKSVKVEATLTPFEDQGSSFKPQVFKLGTGAGVELTGTRRDRLDPLWKYQGDATTVARDWKRQTAENLRQLSDVPAGQSVPLGTRYSAQQFEQQVVNGRRSELVP
jgi:hypothetical protein